MKSSKVDNKCSLLIRPKTWEKFCNFEHLILTTSRTSLMTVSCFGFTMINSRNYHSM